jgi:hypothetical protein
MDSTFSKSALTRLAHDLVDRICNQAGPESSRAIWTASVQMALDWYRRQYTWEGSELLPPITEDPISTKWKKDSFLLDFVIWRRDLDDNKEGAWIACESEWDLKDEAVIKDFEKLLSFRAPLKLMIYDLRNSPPNSRRSAIKSSISKFYWHSHEETYLFLEFVNNEKSASAYTWTYTGSIGSPDDINFINLF